MPKFGVECVALGCFLSRWGRAKAIVSSVQPGAVTEETELLGVCKSCESWLAELEGEVFQQKGKVGESRRHRAHGVCARVRARLCAHACVHVREGLLLGRGREQEAVLRVTLGCC